MDAADYRLVPLFSFPAHTWTNRLRRVFASSKVQTNDPDVSKRFVPILLHRLPNELIDLVPEDPSLEQLLTFLTDYDIDKPDAAEIFMRTDVSSYKPKVRFNHAKANFTKSMSSQSDPDTIAELAWTHVFRSLPESVKPVVSVLNIKRFPTDAQLDQVDRAVEHVNTTATSAGVQVAQTVAAIAGQENTRLDRLEAAVERLITVVGESHQSRQQPTNSNTWQNRSYAPRPYAQQRFQPQTNAQRSNLGPRGQQLGNRMVFQPHDNGNNNAQFCFYHATFGVRARKCQPPCNFTQNHLNS